MYKAIRRHPDHLHIRDRQFIIADQTQGKESLEFVFFWGGPYSQWAYSPFYHYGYKFLTAEHFMMYCKARTFNDHASASLVLSKEDPADVKKIGRNVQNYNESKWSAVRYDIVVMGNVLKFSQNPDFFEVMVTDQDKAIVEASPYDKIWGIGRGVDYPNLDNVDTWNGLNLLGYAIMEARERLTGLPDLNVMSR